MTNSYRGRTTRERKLADKVAREWVERRAAAEVSEREVDLDRASVEAEVELLTPEEGVSPGQACVFYAPEGSRVLGGGWIWRGH